MAQRQIVSTRLQHRGPIEFDGLSRLAAGVDEGFRRRLAADEAERGRRHQVGMQDTALGHDAEQRGADRDQRGEQFNLSHGLNVERFQREGDQWDRGFNRLLARDRVGDDQWAKEHALRGELGRGQLDVSRGKLALGRDRESRLSAGQTEDRERALTLERASAYVADLLQRNPGISARQAQERLAMHFPGLDRTDHSVVLAPLTAPGQEPALSPQDRARLLDGRDPSDPVDRDRLRAQEEFLLHGAGGGGAPRSRLAAPEEAGGAQPGGADLRARTPGGFWGHVGAGAAGGAVLGAQAGGVGALPGAAIGAVGGLGAYGITSAAHALGGGHDDTIAARQQEWDRIAQMARDQGASEEEIARELGRRP